MSTEAALLGLISAVRATPLAIIYGLLLAPRPGRLLLAYTVSGLVVSLGVGIAVVAGFRTSAPSEDAGTTRLVIDLVLGVVALGYAAASAAGWSPRSAGTREPRSGAWSARLRDPSSVVASAAGALTNLPGLFYIAGLIAILATEPTLANAVFQVVVYNLLRFAVPLVAWLAASLDPARTRRRTDAVHAWGTRHSRTLVIGVAVVVGVYLVVKALVGLGAGT
jgi:Sap-like sulfolipid-1-addressing protein